MDVAVGMRIKDPETGEEFTVSSVTNRMIHYCGLLGAHGKAAVSDFFSLFEVEALDIKNKRFL